MASVDLKKVLKENQSVVLVCKSDGPEETVLNICSDLKKSFKKICIVTVNKPCSFWIRKFVEKNIDSSKFYFVDCISASSMEQVPSKQCNYISSPKALTELAIALNGLPKDVELVILDSFSGLTYYNDPFITFRFMNSITARFRKNSLKSICLVVGEAKKELISDMSLFSDKTITI
jgi:hypothetical protein